MFVSGDSATANLTETGAGLTTSGTLTVRDPDLTDAVTASVTAVALSGTTGGLTAADVLGMLSVTLRFDCGRSRATRTTLAGRSIPARRRSTS